MEAIKFWLAKEVAQLIFGVVMLVVILALCFGAAFIEVYFPRKEKK